MLLKGKKYETKKKTKIFNQMLDMCKVKWYNIYVVKGSTKIKT